MFKRSGTTSTQDREPRRLKKRPTGEVPQETQKEQPGHWYNFTPDQLKELGKASDRIQSGGGAIPKTEN